MLRLILSIIMKKQEQAWNENNLPVSFLQAHWSFVNSLQNEILQRIIFKILQILGNPDGDRIVRLSCVMHCVHN